MRFLFIAVAALFLCACSAKQTQLSPPITVDINVSHKNVDDWEAEYSFSQPISSFEFSRNTNNFRREQWKLSSGNGNIEFIKDREVVVLKEPARSFKIFLKTWVEVLPKDYELFRTFSEGSKLLYSGHFEGTPVTADPMAPTFSKYTFVPLSSERVIQNGKIGNLGKASTWDDETGNGTYVYFGNIKPLSTPHLTAILDPALPSWIKNKTLKDLPQLFNFYNQKLNTPLNFKPFVILSVSDLTSEGISYGGGTLPGLVELSIWGRDWKKDSSINTEKYFKFLAHESAHLWNGQLFDDPSETMWLSEGGADAFAYRAMKDVGLISRSRYLELLSGALNSCLMQLNGKPIFNSSGSNGEALPAYTCGSTMHLIIESEIKKTNSKEDLFSIWKSLFAKAKANNNKYSEELYSGTIDNMTGNSHFSKNLVSFIHEGSKNQEVSLIALLNEAGAKTEISENSEYGPKYWQRLWGRKLMQALVTGDCGGISMWGKEDHYLVEKMPSCKTIKEDIPVKKVAGLEIINNGIGAYDKVLEICKDKNKSIAIESENKAYSLKCVVLSKRPSNYKIISVP